MLPVINPCIAAFPELFQKALIVLFLIHFIENGVIFLDPEIFLPVALLHLPPSAPGDNGFKQDYSSDRGKENGNDHEDLPEISDCLLCLHAFVLPERFLRYVLKLVPEFVKVLQILALILIVIDGLAIGAAKETFFIFGSAVRAADHFYRFYSFLRIHSCKPSSK